MCIALSISFIANHVLLFIILELLVILVDLFRLDEGQLGDLALGHVQVDAIECRWAAGLAFLNRRVLAACCDMLARSLQEQVMEAYLELEARLHERT